MSTDAARSLVIEKELPYPPEKIWRALTQGALIKQWLMDNDFQPVAGHRFDFRAKPYPNWNGIIESEVLVVEPCRKLSYRWNSLGLESVVVWTLVATTAGTLLRMEQSGFGPDQKAAYQGASYGWQSFIGKLDQLLAGLPS
jgi:uncharacterized protein YndB with AHSA1/START domain